MSKIIKLLILYQSDGIISESNRFIRPFAEMANKGHIVHLIYTGKITFPHNMLLHRVRKVAFPVISSIPFLVQSFLVASNIMKRNDIEIFLCYREEDILIGWLLKKIWRKISIVYYAHGDSITIQGLISKKIIDKIKYSISIILEKIMLPKVDLVIAVSKDTKLRIMRRTCIPSDKIVVVYNNVLPASTHTVPFMYELKKSNKRIIGYVGHFSELKNIQILLQAFLLLSKEIDDLILVLVGDGPLRAELEKFVRKNSLENKVIFTGWVRNPLDYMQYFDVLVHPSLYEGCPSVILEAFSLNVPVIGSKAGGIPELLKYEELLFQPLDYLELANKLKILLSCHEKYFQTKKLIEERKRVFTFDHVAIIEELLKNISIKSAYRASKNGYMLTFNQRARLLRGVPFLERLGRYCSGTPSPTRELLRFPIGLATVSALRALENTRSSSSSFEPSLLGWR